MSPETLAICILAHAVIISAGRFFSAIAYGIAANLKK